MNEPLPFGTGVCPGVRPGAMVETDEGSCTLNFIFMGGDRRFYAGTAGHCTLAATGETTWAPGTGPVAKDSEGKKVGELAYASLTEDSDFALVRIDRGVKVNSQVCHFGGPTGIYSGVTTERKLIHYFGQGIGIGNASVVDVPLLPARTAAAHDLSDRRTSLAIGISSFGDSGAPVVMNDGRALGVLVADQFGQIVITRLSPEISRAERALSIGLKLQRAEMTS